MMDDCRFLAQPQAHRRARRRSFFVERLGGSLVAADLPPSYDHGRGKVMSRVCEELRDLLSTVQQPGDFYASGRLEVLAPRLVVEGVGQIASPLLPVQAEQLIAIANRAPYGRGSAT